MKYFDWDPKKNQHLKKERDVCFEDVIAVLEEKGYLDIIPHVNAKKYPNQYIYLVELFDYVHMVPFVEDDEKIFLKTIFPSRKATKKYLSKK
jgi:uncharacterized DUF497 family protein